MEWRSLWARSLDKRSGIETKSHFASPSLNFLTYKEGIISMISLSKDGLRVRISYCMIKTLYILKLLTWGPCLSSEVHESLENDAKICMYRHRSADLPHSPHAEI